MRLTRIGDILALMALIPIVALVTRAGSAWVLISAQSGMASYLTVAVLSLTVIGVFGWAIVRVTGGTSVAAALSLAVASMSALCIGYPAWERQQTLDALAPVFAADIGPTGPLGPLTRLRLADYQDGQVYGRGVTCGSGCRALLSEGLVEEVNLLGPLDADPAGLSVRLDRDTPGCLDSRGCPAVSRLRGAPPDLLILRSITGGKGQAPFPPEARGLDLSGWMRIEIWEGGRLILRRTSARARTVPPFTLPLTAAGVGGEGLRPGYARDDFWLSPHRLNAHDPLPDILRALAR